MGALVTSCYFQGCVLFNPVTSVQSMWICTGTSMLLQTSTKCVCSKKIIPWEVWTFRYKREGFKSSLGYFTAWLPSWKEQIERGQVAGTRTSHLWVCVMPPTRLEWQDSGFATLLVLFLLLVSDVSVSALIFFFNSVFQQQELRQLFPLGFDCDWLWGWLEGHESC